jgi:hypothetical protein
VHSPQSGARSACAHENEISCTPTVTGAGAGGRLSPLRFLCKVEKRCGFPIFLETGHGIWYKTSFFGFMVGVAQLVEHLVVAQVVVGSSPITHPIFRKAVSGWARLSRFSSFSPAGLQMVFCWSNGSGKPVWPRPDALSPGPRIPSYFFQHAVFIVCGGILARSSSAPVAQLDRAPDFESVGRGFESLRAYQAGGSNPSGRTSYFKGLWNFAVGPFWLLRRNCYQCSYRIVFPNHKAAF